MEGRLSPIYVTDKEDSKGRKMIDLLLISDGEKQHYCWIKNMSRLVASRTKNHASSLVCRWCVSHFTHDQKIHEEHVTSCREIKASPQRDIMPNQKKGNNIYKFKNWKRRMQVPYYIIADFEALVKEVDGDPNTDASGKNTKKHQEYIPCSYSYIKVHYDGYSYPERNTYIRPNADQKFIQS